MNFEIIIITCDKTSWILPITFYFVQKYLPKDYHEYITVLGFNKPKDFPNEYRFYSMGTEQNIDEWSQDIYKYTSQNIQKEFVMFLLDDFFLLDHLDMDKLNFVLEMMKHDKEIGLCNISYAPQCIMPNEPCDSRADKKLHQYIDTIIHNTDDFLLYEKNGFHYRINCQPAIYNLEHFNKHFQNPKSPWNLELQIDEENKKKIMACSPLRKSNNKKVIFSEKKQQPIYKTQLHSALSKSNFPDKINIHNMKEEDKNYLIENGFIAQEQIINCPKI